MKLLDTILSFFCMQKPKEEAVVKDKEYTYTYYAQTVMGNWSKRGKFTFTVTDAEIKEHGSAHTAGLHKNYDKLSSPFKTFDGNRIRYRCIEGTNNETK